MTTALPEVSFSRAKTGLSSVMDEVVHRHRPQIVQRQRGGGKELMLLVRTDDARRWLDTFRLVLRVTLDEAEVTVVADPVGVVGFGESFDEALDDLVAELGAYAQRFFERSEFYAQTEAARHEPWLLRFALTHPDERRALVDADIEASMPKGNAAVSSAV